MALRSALGLALVAQGAFCLSQPAAPEIGGGLLALSGGALLTAGFLTPLAAALGALCEVAAALFPPACSWNIFETKSSLIFAGAIAVGAFLLGPGALSVDARLFGRREVIIPPRSSGRS